MEYDLLRKCLVQIASRIGVSVETIFELDPRELFLLLETHQEIICTLEERARKRVALKNLYVPKVLSARDVHLIGDEALDDSPVMYGIGITPIVTRGIAVIVSGPNDQEAIGQLVSGSILVSKTTDPTWAPIIASIGKGALVTEIGGPLAHGAIVARDLGIACVQNVPGATRRISTGDLIEVDGRQGIVTLL